MLSLLGAIHQFEIALLRDKTRAGVKSAHAAGRYGGRTPKLNKAQVTQVRKMRADGSSVSTIGKVVGVSRPTIYRALEEKYRVA